MRPRTATEELIERVLGADYLSLLVARYTLTEDVAGGEPCLVTVVLSHEADAARQMEIQGSGVGFVDACYSGLMEHYCREFQSLETIKFTGFDVRGKLDGGAFEHAGADADAVVRLAVENSEGRRFVFEESNRSMIAAALSVVIQAVEYFVNSERAFHKVYVALCDARERSRTDLINSFTAQLAELVRTTSYTRVIERIKAENSLV